MKSSSVQHILKCMHCNRKADKYFKLNRMMKIIDLLLLKRRVFRHYLFNSRESFVRRTVFMFFVVVLAKPVFQSHKALQFVEKNNIDTLEFAGDICIMYKDILKSFAKVMLWLVLVFIAFCRCSSFIRMSSALILSSFYYNFLFIMMMWKYQEEEYLLVIDFLCIACNSNVISELCSIRNEVAVGYICICKVLASLICRKIFSRKELDV